MASKIDSLHKDAMHQLPDVDGTSHSLLSHPQSCLKGKTRAKNRETRAVKQANRQLLEANKALLKAKVERLEVENARFKARLDYSDSHIFGHQIAKSLGKTFDAQVLAKHPCLRSLLSQLEELAAPPILLSPRSLVVNLHLCNALLRLANKPTLTKSRLPGSHCLRARDEDLRKAIRTSPAGTIEFLTETCPHTFFTQLDQELAKPELHADINFESSVVMQVLQLVLGKMHNALARPRPEQDHVLAFIRTFKTSGDLNTDVARHTSYAALDRWHYDREAFASLLD